MLLGFDMDDVVAETIKPLVLFHNEQYGTTLTYEDYTTYDHEKLWGCSWDEANRRHAEFRATNYFRRVVPVEGAVHNARLLSLEHQLVIVSARTENIRGATEEWLDRYFKNVFTAVYLTSHFDTSKDQKTKAEICRELGVDLLVEDALSHAGICEAISLPVLLYDRPWNQNGREDYRVHTWTEIVERIEGMKISERKTVRAG